MTAPTTASPVGVTAAPDARLPRWGTRLVIWGLFFLGLYLVRDFFFTGFLTFLFCYLILAGVGWAMTRLSGDSDRPWLRRLLVLAVFVVVPVVLLMVGILVGPRLLDQGQRAAAWFSNLNTEVEAARLLEPVVCTSEFAREYGTPDDPRYAGALEEFRATGAQHVGAYHDFPAVATLVEASFVKQFTSAQRTRARLRLLHLGTGSKEFTQWFLTRKVPELQHQARTPSPDRAENKSALEPLVRGAATARPEQLLEHARREPAMLAVLRQEWVQEGEEQAVPTARDDPAYERAFRDAYDHARAQHPALVPYTYEQYVVLKKAHADGVRAFGEALEAMQPTSEADREARLHADFEAAKKHELFQHWWSTSPTADFIRRRLTGGVAQWGSAQMEWTVTAIVDLPEAIGTALLLSLFICIDFPRLRQGLRALRGTWLREVYDELAPALSSLGNLIGLSMQAQGLIALCNAVIMFLALELLGVAHAVLLSAAVFVLCLVPTLGLIISWVLVVGMALVQPGGGFVLAMKATGAVFGVFLLETFVFSPRILGKMMELHPVLIITILPIAQYFFGVWGLILATPVAVYVLYELILRDGLPGRAAFQKSATASVIVVVPSAESDASAGSPQVETCVTCAAASPADAAGATPQAHG